jgi:hypothetical protein
MKTVKTYTTVISVILIVGLSLTTLPILASPNPGKVRSEIVSLTGTIHKLVIENTCYQLATDDGNKYELMGKFPKIEGTRVKVQGIIATDTVTICQVGQLVKVKSVRVIK